MSYNRRDSEDSGSTSDSDSTPRSAPTSWELPAGYPEEELRPQDTLGSCSVDDGEDRRSPTRLKGILKKDSTLPILETSSSSSSPSHWPTIPLPNSLSSSFTRTLGKTSADDVAQQSSSVSFPPDDEMITSINSRPRTHILDMRSLYYSEFEIRRFKREYKREKRLGSAVTGECTELGGNVNNEEGEREEKKVECVYDLGTSHEYGYDDSDDESVVLEGYNESSQETDSPQDQQQEVHQDTTSQPQQEKKRPSVISTTKISTSNILAALSNFNLSRSLSKNNVQYYQTYQHNENPDGSLGSPMDERIMLESAKALPVECNDNALHLVDTLYLY